MKSPTPTEAWFVTQGLPYFVNGRRRRAGRWLTVLPLAVTTIFLAGLGVGVAALVESLTSDASAAFIAGSSAFLAGQVVYGVVVLSLAPMLRWAVARTFRSLPLVVPLVTRALPLLLIFITFFFINTEVWQVASDLTSGVLWLSILFFAGVGLLFLLVRISEEMDRVDDEAGGEHLVRVCLGTPVEDQARALAEVDVREIAQVRGLEKGNLVFVLLVAQLIQVLLLAYAVYLFFVLFGAVAIQPDVIESWIGHPPTPIVPGFDAVNEELLQVSTFLAGFSGLYFAVYAVSDETYRKQFFASLEGELERAVAVRAVYRWNTLQSELSLGESPPTR